MPFLFNPFTGNLDLTGTSTGGDVVGPGSATDNAVARFDGTTGELLQNSVVTIDDLGNIVTPVDVQSDTVNTNNLTSVDATFSGDVEVQATTAARVLISDNNNFIASSSVTTTELGYVSGVTSSIQTQLDSKIPLTQKGAANGVATLDGGGKIPSAQLPSSVMEYKGTWNASTNTPTLADGVGDAGDVYLTTVAGTVDFGSGPISFAIGDWAVYSGTIWEKSINSNSVVSVNGFTGVVVLDTDDIAEGANLYYTDERAQDAVGNILSDTSSIDFTYADGTPSITASVIPSGVDHNSLQNYVANEHVNHSSVQITTAADSGLAGGGDITATRNLVVDINGTTAETVVANNDEVLIWDTSAAARRKITRSNFLSGIAFSSPGDLVEASFSAANNQAVAADVTGFVFANGTVRSFDALVSVAIDATSDLFEEFKLQGIQRGADWTLAVQSNGDNSGLSFSITNSGQIQYTSSNIAGFVSNSLKFRAITTSV